MFLLDLIAKAYPQRHNLQLQYLNGLSEHTLDHCRTFAALLGHGAHPSQQSIYVGGEVCLGHV